MPIYTPLRFRISPSPRNPKKNIPARSAPTDVSAPGRTSSARRRHPTRRRHVSPRDRIAAAVPAREAQEGPPRARAPAPLPPLGRRRLPDLRRPAPSPPPHRPPPRRAPPPVRSSPRARASGAAPSPAVGLAGPPRRRLAGLPLLHRLRRARAPPPAPPRLPCPGEPRSRSARVQ